MIISLVICTYNRADLLEGTVPFLSNLLIPENIKFEVIFVNNNSTDSTKAVIETFIEDSDLNAEIRYEFEGKQGLSHARNKGFNASSGEYIAYIDDECILPSEWLKEAVDTINSEYPAFLGGPYLGKYFPGDSSKWYLESFGDSYLLNHKLKNGVLKNYFLSGGNMFIRRDVFEKIGLFDTSLGMNGEDVGYGEEVELQQRLLAKFPSECIWYNPRVFVWHCIREEKMTITFLFKDGLVRGYSSAHLLRSKYKKLKFAPIMLVYFSIKAIVSFLVKLLSSFFSKEHFFTLLYDDYRGNTWSDIGRAWYRTRLLLKSIFTIK